MLNSVNPQISYCLSQYMDSLSPSERFIWHKTITEQSIELTDDQISEKYDRKAERIVTETNREKLPNFYDSLRRPGYMDARPFYQRRDRWDQVRQSRLIESLLINIPIPPLFVYEVSPNSYEVMDGQQRLTAIKSFYSNELVLKGLERWPELNGKNYSKLPEKIRAGIDRRTISWITVLYESTSSEEEAFLLKQLVFERLNTGGVKLGAQEIRNALYAGPFNKLLIELAKDPHHRHAWKMPEYSSNEEDRVPKYLEKNAFYREMEDVEVILRFFALRHAQQYQRGMKSFLDLYMIKAREFTAEDLRFLRDLYLETLKTAHDIFGQYLFVPFDSKKEKWGSRPQKSYADAVMVALCQYIPYSSSLISHADSILSDIQVEFIEDAEGVMTGRGNTKTDIIKRIEVMSDIYRKYV
ncbi:DUF262 domain-containing protein [Burkholderia ambifaria]|uniref:DUF262 domain-containing protein n=1 Tax=Burkholderia ambifaria TaxID=152480 RepID=UPI001ABA4AE6|nr:DUF262 domain-containing protein [Burkholderia ambifaria]